MAATVRRNQLEQRVATLLVGQRRKKGGENNHDYGIDHNAYVSWQPAAAALLSIIDDDTVS